MQIAHPNSQLRSLWALVSLMFVTYDFFCLTLSLLKVVPETYYIDFCMHLFWCIDVLYTFRTGVFVDFRLETGVEKIAIEYAKSWLLIDLLVVVP